MVGRSDPTMWMLVQLNLKLPSRAEGMTCFYVRHCTQAEAQEKRQRGMMSDRIDTRLTVIVPTALPTKPISTMTMQTTL